jgi:hypothetical protein
MGLEQCVCSCGLRLRPQLESQPTECCRAILLCVASQYCRRPGLIITGYVRRLLAVVTKPKSRAKTKVKIGDLNSGALACELVRPMLQARSESESLAQARGWPVLLPLVRA